MLSNTKIKYIQSLYQKKKRDAEGVFIAEGEKIVNELLNSGAQGVVDVFATPEWAEKHKSGKCPVTVISESELARISALTTPNQALAIVKKHKPEPIPDTITGITVGLDGIQDPGNLGTIIRTCDWFGVNTIICSEDCADCYNSKVVQSTMGSFIRVNLFYTSLATFLQTQKNTPVYAAMLAGEPLSVIKKPEKGILMIGNESRGIRPELHSFCTHRVSIEKKGGAESLNAAVACGILLNHFT